jgi:hypothetical protein
MNSVDFTPVILAQLTDLQMRVTKQEATIAALTASLERLGGRPTVTDGSTMRTSVPLHAGAPEYKPRGGDSRYDSRPQRTGPRTGAPSGGAAGGAGASRPRPKVAPSDKSSTGRPTMSLSDVLKSGEEVSIHVHTGKDKEGDFIDSVAVATFDGTDLTVNECADVPALVNMKSSKPGEILYKFIDELKSQGVIKKTFTIAPWRLCFVERDGVRKSLEELRSTVG